MAIVRLTTQVDDVQGTLALYDRIQYWRSTSTESGIYTEITSPSGSAAVIVGSVSAPFSVNGLQLNISLSGADPVEIPFTTTDPISITQLCTLINAAMPSPVAFPGTIDDSKLQIINPLTGTQSSIALSGSALSPLGLAAQASGTAPRTLMGNIVSSYQFADYAGDPAYWYKTRFSSSLTGAASIFSAAQQGAPTQVLPDNQLVLVTVDLANITGAPVVGRRIIIVPVALQQILNNTVDYGLLPRSDSIELTTDEFGHAEVSLALGATIRVFFEATGYSRECVITAPVSPATSVDLLALLSTQPDPFTIVKAPPMPIREG